MNDDSALLASTSRIANAEQSAANDAGQEDGVTLAEVSEHHKAVRDVFNKKRVQGLNDIIRNVDILVYAELSIIYYMDCHLLRFLLRAIIQFMFLTPKPAAFPRPPKPEPYVGAIVGTNILCLLLHVISKAPSASEATRFYLHGGLVLDFIGQKGPSSKLSLVMLDLLVVVLQLVTLSAHLTRQKLKDGVSVHSTTRPTLSRQDIDSEERGVRRSIELQRQEVQEGIELQALNGAGRATAPVQENIPDQERRTAVLESTAPRLHTFLLESFWNGQVVMADLNPLRIAWEQIRQYQETPMEARRDALNVQLSARMSEFRYMTRRR